VLKYEVKDGSIIDGLSALSRSPNLALHLGIEEALRERLATPEDRSVKISLSIEKKTVQDILNTLCDADPRYTWSMDASTINIYPRARVHDATDLLNFQIERIQLGEIPDPDQALTPLSNLFPGEQVGYTQIGLGDFRYAVPWTVTFEHLTVRQFINRIAEHVGPHTSWIWQGGKDSRMFTFLKGGFH